MEETISQEELKARKILENLVRDNRIFMDTCSIIDASDLFWKHIKPFLTKYEKKIIVPTRCCEELVKKSRDEKDAGLAKTANTRLFLLQTLQTEGFIEFREAGDGVSGHAEAGKRRPGGRGRRRPERRRRRCGLFARR